MATRPVLLIASLVTEGRKMSHFITQFYLECQIHQTSLATLWTDPNPVLPSLVGIPNHWLKGGLWVKNPPRLLQTLSPNPPGWSTSDPLLVTSQTIEWPSALSVPRTMFSITQHLKRGQYPPGGPICSCANIKNPTRWDPFTDPTDQTKVCSASV